MNYKAAHFLTMSITFYFCYWWGKKSRICKKVVLDKQMVDCIPNNSQNIHVVK